ncbi:MAG TPA: crossover junction endodeoxyribonuclease RuvC, partial [Acidimicrobiales bacterium]|nr:crossover junction endodeoxyribonuclease RuvC [Acidimicrobiales bacterium]
MFELGIDPGLSRCGYGVLEQDKSKSKVVKAVAAGVIRTPPKTDLAVRLAELQEEIRSLIDEYEPEEV